MSVLAAVMRREADLLLPTYERLPVLFERGHGVYLYDCDGRKYLDFLSGLGVTALGHGHPAIQRAIRKQAWRLIHVSNLFFHRYQAQVAAALTRISGLDRAFFCNSGTEAWEGALKLARAHARQTSNGSRPRARLLVMENSFHGRTFGSLATTGQKKYRAPFAPLVPGVRFVRFNDVADLRRKFDEHTCAIGLETVQGEGGIRPVSPEFVAAARRMSERSGALLLLDEVQCGLGRTGRYFAYQHYGVHPDIVTVAKPLAAGLPLGAILTTATVARAFHPGMHGTTFGGGPLACAAASAFLETLRSRPMLRHIRRMGSHFRSRLLALQARHAAIREVRGMGLMLGVELDSADRAKAMVRGMLDRGFVINRTQETVLRFLPPYVIEPRHVDEVIRALDQLLASARISSPGPSSTATRRKTQ